MGANVHAESNNEDENAMAEASVDDDSVLQLDPETLDPDMKYRFIFNHPNRIARLQMRGYEFVTEDDAVKLRYTVAGQVDDSGHILVGDSVLMRCPRKRYDRRRRDIRERTDARMGEAASAKALEEIQNVSRDTGIPVPTITKY